MRRTLGRAPRSAGWVADAPCRCPRPSARRPLRSPSAAHEQGSATLRSAPAVCAAQVERASTTPSSRPRAVSFAPARWRVASAGALPLVVSATSEAYPSARARSVKASSTSSACPWPRARRTIQSPAFAAGCSLRQLDDGGGVAVHPVSAPTTPGPRQLSSAWAVHSAEELAPVYWQRGPLLP
jgi:hypothetical protein